MPREWDSPHVKANLLLQCVMSRAELPISDYYTDTRSVLDQCIRVLQAMVDVSCEFAWGQTVLRVVLLMQCLVQGRWPDDSSLMNVPHSDERLIAALWDEGVECLPQLMAMDPSRRAAVCARVGLREKQVEEVAAYLRRMPSIDMSVQVDIAPGTRMKKKRQRPVHIAVITEALNEQGRILPRTDDADEEDEDEETEASASSPGILRLLVQLQRTNAADASTRILSPVFNKPKDEGWWLLLMHPRSQELLLCKRVSSLRNRVTATLVCPMPARGVWEYRVLLLSDSYMGLDQERTVRVESDEDDVVGLPIAQWTPNVAEDERAGQEDISNTGRRDWAEKVIGSVDDEGQHGKAAGKGFTIQFDPDDEGY